MAPKTVLVTGCSAGGIGAAIALSLAKRSHHVFATVRNASKIPPELSSLPNVTVLSLDVKSPASVAEAVQAVAASGRTLDVLVNNAGAGYSAPVLDIDIEEAKQVYDANVWGVVRVIQAFADQLIKSKGRIVNMSSCGAAVNTPWISAYSSSKSALTNISETLRLELSPFGVSVATVMIGVVNSHFHDNQEGFKLPEGSRYAPIEEIIAGWVAGTSKPGGCTAEEFAESLVNDIVAEGKGGMLWRGPHAGSIKILTNWLPSWSQDAAMSVNQGLKELSQDVAGKQKN